MADARNLNATCEEYHSDDSEDHVLETFRRSPAAAAGQANVSARRSHPSDLGAEKPVAEKVINSDLQSDSGYSSHTAATMSSADSAPSAKASKSPSTAPSSAASIPPPSPAASKRRSHIVTDERQSSRQSSPRKPLQRSGSTASRRPPGNRRSTVTESEEVCRDPTCTKCGPNAVPSRGRRPPPTPLDSGLDISYPPSHARSDPVTSSYTPRSPTYTRQPVPYTQGSTYVQPAQTRRRDSSTSRRSMSYHGEPGPNYWVPGMPVPYPSPPQEHGPPPSMSAYHTMQQYPQMGPQSMISATPPSANYWPNGHPMAQISPPYEQQRPPMSARGSFQARGRPQSGYGPALITQSQPDRPEQPLPSARYGNAPASASSARFPQRSEWYESSEEESSEEEEERQFRRDRALMPPPDIKRNSSRRPSLRRADTTQGILNDRRLSMSQQLPERPKERDPRASRISTAAPSRQTSVKSKNRPALIQHPDARSSYEPSRSGKVMVEDSRRSRRQSQQLSYEKDYEVDDRRRNRDSKIYADDAETVVIPERSRRRTDASVRKRDEYVVPQKERRTTLDAEAYQAQTRGSIDPINDKIHKAAKRASRIPSDAGSSRSDDKKSRVSQSARTNMTNGNANGEIRLRVDASAPLSLSFNGDMEGRTLQINPAEGGMADIVIGSSGGGESTYRSERGSVTGTRRAQIASSARRDAEELSSQRSGRSSQGRREGERRAGILRRRTEYF